MSTSWLRWLCAAAMIGVVLFHVVRLVSARARGVRPDAELAHAAMGAVMAVMLVGVLGPSDGRLLAVGFAASLVWFVWRGLHSFVMDGARAVGAPVRLVVGCAAMVYMLVVLSLAGPSMPGMTMPVGSPALVVTLLVATLGVAAWTLIRPVALGLPRSPALAAGCQLAMNAATVYMLVAL
jgi:hypothetical protein